MSERCKIETALFGYREGHNLIASSTTFASSIRVFLATATDSSGSESSRGFQAAYTGIPVPDTNYYALFCTWPAPEMPRPGCVWSHVLLINLADFARIPDLSLLKQYFRRPEARIDHSKYNNTIDFEIPEPPPSLGSTLLPRAGYLMRMLYGAPTASVVVLSEESSPWEESVFAIWSQQWPKLRRDFTFSTGSLGDRGLAGKAFDLQIAPQSSRRIWGRKTSYLTLVAESFEESEKDPRETPWLQVALDDLQNSDGGLRGFFFQFGSDLRRLRASFIPLVDAYRHLEPNSRQDPVRQLMAVGESFPDPRDAVRLKEFLIFPDKTSPSDAAIERALATLTFLFERREADAYSEVKFDVTGLAKELWDRKRDWVIWQLSRLVDGHNLAASGFETSIANSIHPTDLRGVADQSSAVALLLIRRRKELAFYPSTWTLWGRTQQEIFDTLTDESLTEEEWGKVMGAMLIAATYVSIRQAVEKAGNHVMPGAFRWLEDPIAKTHLPSQPWRDALAHPARRFLGHIDRLPSAQLALAAWFCPTEAIREVLSPMRADVNELANSLGNLPPLLVRPSAFLLMTLGLRSNALNGLPLIVRSFEIVNEALASKDYAREGWDLLSPELPFIGWRRDWDRCAKLKLAVHQWLKRHAHQIDASLAEQVEDVNRTVSEESGMHQESDDY